MARAESGCFGDDGLRTQVPGCLVHEPVDDDLRPRRALGQALLELRGPLHHFVVADARQPRLEPAAGQLGGQGQQQIDQALAGALRPEPELGALRCGSERAPRDSPSLVRVGAVIS